MNIVEERSHYFITLDFTDENGDAVTPGSAYYRVDDLFSKNQIKTDTAITISSTSGTIHLQGIDTEIVDEGNAIEYREIYAYWTYYEGTKSNNKVINYAVKNIWKKASMWLHCDTGEYEITGKTVTLT